MSTTLSTPSLSDVMAGRVIVPADGGWDSARRAFNPDVSSWSKTATRSSMPTAGATGSMPGISSSSRRRRRTATRTRAPEP